MEKWIINFDILKKCKELGRCVCKPKQTCPCDDFLQKQECKCKAFELWGDEK